MTRNATPPPNPALGWADRLTAKQFAIMRTLTWTLLGLAVLTAGQLLLLCTTPDPTVIVFSGFYTGVFTLCTGVAWHVLDAHFTTSGAPEA